MKTTRKLLTTIAAGIVLMALTAGAASAAGYVSIGDFNHDRDGQGVQMGSATCTVKAGDPVVVTINGRRHLRATNTVFCNKRVTMGKFYAGLGDSDGLITQKQPGVTITRSQASVVIQRPCKNFGYNTYEAAFEVHIDLNNDGYYDAEVYDLSRWNGRSCNA